MDFIIPIFLVFAGMLIRHFLSSGNLAALEEQRLTLMRENEELRGEVAHLANARTSLDEQCSRQKGQLNVLQQLCDDWSEGREQSDRHRAQLEVDLEHWKEQADKISAELELQTQKHITLEDKIHQQEQSHAEKVGALETQWNVKLCKVETTLKQQQTDLATANAENDRISQQLHQSQARVAELESQIETNERLLETAQKNASGLKKEYVSLESSLRESSHLLQLAKSECATAVSGRQVAQDSIRSLQTQYEQLQREHEQLRNRLTAAEAIGRQNDSLKVIIDSTKTELLRVAAQRDEAMNAHKSALTMAAGLQTRIDNQEATIHGLRDSRAEAVEKAKHHEAMRAQLETKAQQQSQQFVSDQNESKLALEAELDQHSKTIAQLSSERDLLSRQLAETQNNISTITASLAEREKSLAQLESEVEEVGTLQVRIRELEALLHRRESEMEKLNVSSEEAELLRQQFSNLQDQYAIARRRQVEMEANLARLQAERKRDQSAEENYQSQLKQFQTKLSASADTIRALRRERAAVLARLANYRTVVEPDRSVISFTQAMELQRQQHENYDPEYGGHTSMHAKRGLVYVSEPETRDDLKQISGIAEVLEARLNDFGIYTFKQIMDWSPEAIDEFSELLAFRDRIQRDAWQDQARYFYHQKHANRKQSAA